MYGRSTRGWAWSVVLVTPLAYRPGNLLAPRATGHACALDPGLVLACPSVDADRVAFLDKQRHLHHQPGLQRGGFARTGCRIAGEAGLGRLDLQVNTDRQFDADRLALVARAVEHHAVGQVRS